MFENINARELTVFVEVLKVENNTEEMLSTLELIDDLLTIQKSRYLLNSKGSHLKTRKMYEKRIEQSIN